MNILIYSDYNRISPHGGPNGVSYFIKERAAFHKNSSIHFLNENKIKSGDNHKTDKKASKLKVFLYRFKRMLKLIQIYYVPFKYVDTDLAKFDVVHFQDTFHMFQCRKQLDEYQGKIVLMSHSPVPYHQEMMSDALRWEKILFGWVLKKYETMDTFCFTNADMIIFPCREAEESYIKNWEVYKELRKEIKHKIQYVTTGIMDPKVKLSKIDVREKHGIPDDAFLVCYAGRHNEIKGYDRLKKIASSVFDLCPDIWFLIAGKEGPLYRLNNEHWIEVGWTDDPYSLIKASDVLALPNRETYFDIAFIEALALGKIIIGSRTGGNKFYEKFNSPGIILFDDDESFKTKLLELYRTSILERKDYETFNRKLFENEFTSEKYYQNYLDLINNLH